MNRREKNCVVVMKIKEVEQFWNMMIEAIELADKNSPVNKDKIIFNKLIA
jgi:hypothetical protein